ncbi:MAG: hypothetical protein P9M00_07300 [Candidatus Tritonobacter lacicola]|nr:hypothetical protein [Candidatus Tritonobacter lacicola]
MISNREKNWIVGSIFVFAAVMGIAYVVRGRLSGDEGWYLHASKLVMDGKAPYSDFFFTQAPLLPYIFGPVLRLIGESYYAGRTLCLALLLAGMGMMWKVSRDISGPAGEIVATALVGLNLFVIMQACSVMTPALALFFITASVFSLRSSCSPPMRAILSVLFMSMGAMVRLSLLPAVPLLVIYLYLAEGKRTSIVVVAIVTAVIALGAMLLPFVYLGGDRFFFGALGFHTSSRLASPALFIRYKLGFIGGCIREYLPVVFLGAVMITSLVLRFRRRSGGEFITYLKRNHFPVYLGATAVLVTLSHLTITMPWPTYEVMLLPLMALVIGAWTWSRLSSLNLGRKATLLAVISIIILACLAMPLEEYAVDAGGPFSPVEKMFEVCRFIEQNARRPITILTLDAGIAYQGGFDLLPGLEMSEFSYFPTWSRERCGAYNVVNVDILREAIGDGVPGIIALRNRDIYMIGGKNPAGFMDLIRSRYRWINTATQYGQFYEPLHIFKRKKEVTCPGGKASPGPETFPGIPDHLLPW